MKVLGIYSGHVATAALMDNGKVIGCVSEERFTGVKGQCYYPKQSVEYLKKEFKLKPEEIDEVVLPLETVGVVHVSDDAQKSGFLMGFLVFIYRPFYFARRVLGIISYYLTFLKPPRVYLYKVVLQNTCRLVVKKERQHTADMVGVPLEKVTNYNHHLCHASAAYYGSPYSQDKALVLTLDGEGDFICASVNVFEKYDYKVLATTPRSESLGLIYMYLTKYLGMTPNEHEYKVMGLAPYAKDYSVNKLYKRIEDLVVLDPENKLRFKAKIHVSETPYYLSREMKGERFDNIAGAFQKLLEVRVVEWVTEAIKTTGIKTVCLGGGVFMNVKLNQKLMEIPELEKIFIMPSAADESTAIGACYYATLLHNQKNPQKIELQPMRELYLGCSFTNEEVKQFLTANKVADKYKVEYVEDVETRTAQLLQNNKVVARLNGKMEWGARALGNRSILANPSDYEVVRIINEEMKDRDFWMPFTPSVLTERISDYFINPKKVPAPYMIITFDSTALAQKDLRSALHPYDFTGRPQQVYQDWNPKYHNLLKAFENLTGIGGVLNTSFNLHGYPIVLGPKEAYHAFENSGIKYLTLENYLISKE